PMNVANRHGSLPIGVSGGSTVAILLPSIQPRRARVILAAMLAASAIGTACKPSQPREPISDSERLVRRRQLLPHITPPLPAVPSFRVRAIALRSLGPHFGKGAPPDPGRGTGPFAHEIVVRRPHSLYIRAIDGPNMEGWYNGDRLILAARHDKVFGVAPMP